MKVIASQLGNLHPGAARPSTLESGMAWGSIDDTALAHLIAAGVAGLILLVPALLLVSRLYSSLETVLSPSPQAIERVELRAVARSLP